MNSILIFSGQLCKLLALILIFHNNLVNLQMRLCHPSIFYNISINFIVDLGQFGSIAFLELDENTLLDSQCNYWCFESLDSYSVSDEFDLSHCKKIALNICEEFEKRKISLLSIRLVFVIGKDLFYTIEDENNFENLSLKKINLRINEEFDNIETLGWLLDNLKYYQIKAATFMKSSSNNQIPDVLILIRELNQDSIVHINAKFRKKIYTNERDLNPIKTIFSPRANLSNENQAIYSVNFFYDKHYISSAYCPACSRTKWITISPNLKNFIIFYRASDLTNQTIKGKRVTMSHNTLSFRISFAKSVEKTSQGWSIRLYGIKNNKLHLFDVFINATITKEISNDSIVLEGLEVNREQRMRLVSGTHNNDFLFLLFIRFDEYRVYQFKSKIDELNSTLKGIFKLEKTIRWFSYLPLSLIFINIYLHFVLGNYILIFNTTNLLEILTIDQKPIGCAKILFNEYFKIKHELYNIDTLYHQKSETLMTNFLDEYLQSNLATSIDEYLFRYCRSIENSVVANRLKNIDFWITNTTELNLNLINSKEENRTVLQLIHLWKSDRFIGFVSMIFGIFATILILIILYTLSCKIYRHYKSRSFRKLKTLSASTEQFMPGIRERWKELMQKNDS
ncbi:alkaline phosphatase [Sarcoptes scabiei]|nr:alkaline phosphatase [Sarcoptes scabiei]